MTDSIETSEDDAMPWALGVAPPACMPAPQDARQGDWGVSQPIIQHLPADDTEGGEA